MSAFRGVLNTAAIALAAATAKTVATLTAPSNHRVKILEWGVAFDGVAPTAVPVLVELIRSTGGTGTTQAPLKCDPSLTETLQTGGKVNYSAEGTPGDVLMRVLVHPQGGYVYQAVPGDEDMIPGAGVVGIRCTAPAVVNVVARIKFEE